MDLTKYTVGMRGHDMGNNFDELCAASVKENIKAVQLALPITFGEKNFDEIGYNEDLCRQIKSRFDEISMKTSVLSCYINPVDQNSEALERQLIRFENFMNYTKELNARVIGTETGSVGTLEKTHSEENYKFFLKNITRLVDKAEQAGVCIGIEPVWVFTIYSPQILRRLIDDVKSKNLKVILDPINMLNNENFCEQKKIIYDSFNLFGDRVEVIHCKDAVLTPEGIQSAVPCEGQFDIKYLFECIDSLSKKPDIILDGLPIANYRRAIENLGKLNS